MSRKPAKSGKARQHEESPPVDPRPPASEKQKAYNARAEAAMRERYRDRPQAPKLDMSVLENGKVNVQNGHCDEDEGFAWRFCETVGTQSTELACLYTAQLADSLNSSGDAAIALLPAALAFMAEVAPQSGIEGALAVQMWATHCATVELSRRLRRADDLERVREYSNLMNKTARTFTGQVEALAKLRTGGKQQVVVKHVYVQGNAVVGDGAQAVMQYGGGGGEPGNLRQAQTISGADALGAEVWSADALGLSVQGASGQGQAALPDARWGTGLGGAEGEAERELSPRPEDAGSRARAAAVSDDPEAR